MKVLIQVSKNLTYTMDTPYSRPRLCQSFRKLKISPIFSLFGREISLQSPIEGCDEMKGQMLSWSITWFLDRSRS